MSCTTRASIVTMKKLNGIGLESCSSQEAEGAGKSWNVNRWLRATCPDCEETPGVCSLLLTLGSVLIVLATLPFSLLYTIKVVQVHLSPVRSLPAPPRDKVTSLITTVQEYERAVIFRLGRLVSGGARGPGVFFIIPCVDVYEKIDMRTTTYEIPPQEVNKLITKGLQFRTKIVD